MAVTAAMADGLDDFILSTFVTLFGAFLALFSAFAFRIPLWTGQIQSNDRIFRRAKLAVEVIGAGFVIWGVVLISTWHQQILMGLVAAALVAFIVMLLVIAVVRKTFLPKHGQTS